MYENILIYALGMAALFADKGSTLDFFEQKPDDRNQCFKLGCLDYHIKSSDNHMLIEAIKSILMKMF